MKKNAIAILIAFLFLNLEYIVAKPFSVKRNDKVYIDFNINTPTVANTALEILRNDMKEVLDAIVIKAKAKATIKTKITKRLKRPEQFKLFVDNKGVLNVEAADEHGLAYGLLEISRLMGVSPWEWWADATPKKLDSFQLNEGFMSIQAPSVRYRGIFINDEDWGMEPWSNQTMEPQNPKGVIGVKTTEKIFELLLRLRANTYWPPMHECSHPFFLTEGNRQVAQRYGIYIGTSHCEPMACNANGEWKIRGKGEYNYVVNEDGVRRFWQERIDSVKNQEIIYTVGMRGIHDGVMQGVNNLQEHKNVLQRVIDQQLKMLPDKAPKVFVPYKEVLDVYNEGLELHDDITLMWTDDNYGYIRHFPTLQERKRKGGNGVYYHVSYWGRPHDYLWLGTFSPYLLFQQMNEAYDRGIQEMWILNVGDIKPAEYQTELFLDMAWDIETVKRGGVNQHLSEFLTREFGNDLKEGDIARLTDVMNEHYRLSFVRKPEMIAGTRTEESDRVYWNTPREIDWTQYIPNAAKVNYPKKRLDKYEQISDEVELLWEKISPQRQDCFYQLVKYPVQAADMMNRKFLVWQTSLKQKAELLSNQAYDSLTVLTNIYNKGFHNNGKWNGMMDMQPRRLPVFFKCNGLAEIDDETEGGLLIMNEIENPEKIKPMEGLGYEGKAFQINSDTKNDPLVVNFNSDTSKDVDVAIAVIPTLPVDNLQNVLQIAIDDGPYHDLHFETQGRSEQWKQNVLANRAIQHVKLPLGKSKTSHFWEHKLYIRSLSDGIIIDDIYIYRSEHKATLKPFSQEIK